ncbi:MAG: hypothetical protein D6737_09400 [Chloroflexi bacterium]|nr:MAG: hypothetical protein D6737_09400 [Chloroflexota bacterium]
MVHQPNIYDVSLERGFLPEEDPLSHLADVESELDAATIAYIEDVAAELPALIEGAPQKLHDVLRDMPVFDLSAVTNARVCERLFMIYAYFASGYVYAIPDEPADHIPPGVAIPFHQIASLLERPPILSYPAMVLNNWRRRDVNAPIELGNLDVFMSFRPTPDEHWFSLVHVFVEAKATLALDGLQMALQAAQHDDMTGVCDGLNNLAQGMRNMLAAFHRMPEGCDPDVYATIIRPYMFGFNGVVYQGVAAYNNEPQTMTGGSGAQSSTVPAFVGVLGIQHEQTGLMRHLNGMRHHMPVAHRQFIDQVTTPDVRNYVLAHRHNGELKDAYNQCIKQLIVFRRAHFHYAREYIFKRSPNPTGTGGTPFMDWLTQLIEETEAHLVS